MFTNKKSAWQQYEKQELSHGWKLPESSVSIRKNGINLSENLRGFFNGFYGVEIFLNNEEGFLGLKPSQDRLKSFKIKRYSKNFSFAFRSSKIVPDTMGIFSARWDAVEEMVIIDLNKNLE